MKITMAQNPPWKLYRPQNFGKQNWDEMKLTKKEKKIYDSIIKNFPATKKETAYDYAIQGGVKFQFIYR